MTFKFSLNINHTHSRRVFLLVNYHNYIVEQAITAAAAQCDKINASRRIEHIVLVVDLYYNRYMVVIS